MTTRKLDRSFVAALLTATAFAIVGLPLRADQSPASMPASAKLNSPQAAARETDSVSPFDYGAAGDGTADDTSAVSAWLDSGRPLRCSGKFNITQPISITASRGLDLRGSGSAGCLLKLASPAAGITMTLPASLPREGIAPEIVIHDVAFSIAAVIPGVALHIVAEPTRYRVERRADLRDISFMPESKAMSAGTCLELTDLLNSTIESVSCWGRHERGYLPGSTGLLVDGQHVPGDLMIRDVDVYFMEEGFRLAQSWQGVSIETSVCVACRIGVYADGNEDWLRVLNSHFNVYDYGVLASNIFFSEIRGNLTLLNTKARPNYPRKETTSPACYHFEMRSPTGAASVIRDNLCDGHARTPQAGVQRVGVFVDGFAGSANSQTDMRTENVMQNLDVGTMLGPNARGVIVGPDITAGVSVPKRSLSRPGANAAVAPVPF